MTLDGASPCWRRSPRRRSASPWRCSGSGWWCAASRRRRYGAFLAAASLAWVAFAVLVVIPRYNAGEGSEFVDRYGSLGSDGGGVAHDPGHAPLGGRRGRRLVRPAQLPRRPAAAAPAAARWPRPCSLAGALPELLINILADWFPQYSIEFQYVAVIVPFAVAASILGPGAACAACAAPRCSSRFLRHPGRVAAVWVGAVALAGVYQGPLPWWDNVPLVGSDSRVEQYRVDDHAARHGARDRPHPRRRPGVGRQPLRRAPVRARAHLHLPGDRRRRVGDRRQPPALHRRPHLAPGPPPAPWPPLLRAARTGGWCSARTACMVFRRIRAGAPRDRAGHRRRPDGARRGAGRPCRPSRWYSAPGPAARHPRPAASPAPASCGCCPVPALVIVLCGLLLIAGAPRPRARSARGPAAPAWSPALGAAGASGLAPRAVVRASTRGSSWSCPSTGLAVASVALPVTVEPAADRRRRARRRRRRHRRGHGPRRVAPLSGPGAAHAARWRGPSPAPW